DTAVYAVAFYIGTVIAVPQRSIEKITTPLIAEYIRRRKWAEVEEIYRKTSLTQVIAGTFILLLIWVNSGHLLNLLPAVYSDGQYVILFIGLGKLFDMATGANGSIIINSRHYRFDLASNLLLIFFTVSTNLLLIPSYGIHGAAVATMLSLFLYNLIKLVFVWTAFSMQPFSKEFIWLIVLALVSLGVISLLPGLGIIPHLAATLLILSATFLFPVWLLGLSADLNRLVSRLLSGNS
ncbi:MAG: polysaccharide biosynthesis C-terminal domain-containing protein, partial [Balneolaceae bacterium]